jgi:phage/plasmid-associated DNA primase
VSKIYDENEIIAFLKKDMGVIDWWKELVEDWNKAEGPLDFEAAKRKIPWSEVLTSEVIHKKLANRLSYVALENRWYVWNGMIHVPCEGVATVEKIVKMYARHAIGSALDFIAENVEKQARIVKAQGGTDIDKEVAKVRGIYTEGFKKYRQFRDRLSSKTGLSAIVQCLQTDCAISSEYFADDTRWFVMRNWVMDLDAFKAGVSDSSIFLKHSPERNVTKFFDADYAPNENLGHWDSFLCSSLPNERVRRYIQQVVGAGFMGMTKMKVILNFLGQKDSGKSILLESIYRLNTGGAGYAAMPDSMAIIKVNGQNFEQDDFKGRRWVAISEPDENQPADTPFLKRFSGDVNMKTGGKHANSKNWTPQGILAIASNRPLRINIRDGATVDRIKIIQFPHRFYPAGPGVAPEFEMIPDIEDRIERDSSRVLSWIIEGMFALRANGFKLDEPVEVKLSQDDVVTDTSSALEWLKELIDDDMLVVDYEAPLSHCLQVSYAYGIYKMWCVETGIKALSRKYFSTDIQLRYGETKKSAGVRFPGLAATENFTNKWDQFLNYSK